MRPTGKKESAFPAAAGESADPLAEMARIRVVHLLSQPDGEVSLEATVEELLEQSLAQNPTGWSEATRNVMRGVVEGLSEHSEANAKIRVASESAVLAVARRWGNIVSAGKATVMGTREAAGKAGINSTLAAQQASLGAMEGALQAGPIVYPILKRELTPIVEDFNEVLTKERRSLFVDTARRVVPDHDELAPPKAERKPKLEEHLVPPEVEPDRPAGELNEVAPPSVELLPDSVELPPTPERIPPEEVSAAPLPATLTPVQQAISQATRPPKKSLWQSFTSWVGGLFGKRKN